MSSLDDVVLREAFRELRSVERAAAPRFRPRVAAGDRLKPVLHQAFRTLAAAMLTLVIVTTFAMLLRTPSPSTDATLTNWKAPTDFLLQTPQADLLRNVPQFGERTSTQ